MRNIFSTFLGVFHFTQAQTCESLDGGDFSASPPRVPSVCYGLVDYSIYSDGTCQATKEAQLAYLPTLNTLLSDSCKIAINLSTCGLVYTKCSSPESPESVPPCRSMCQAVNSNCNNQELAILTLAEIYSSDDYDCDNWPEESCNSGPSHTVTTDHLQEPKCITYPGGVCENSVPSSIYIPAGYSYEILESSVSQAQFTFALTPRDNRCDALHQAFTCASAYMECEIIDFSIEAYGIAIQIPGPKLSCNEFCNVYKTNCQGFFALSPALRAVFEPDCSKTQFGTIYDCDWNPSFENSQASYPTQDSSTIIATIQGQNLSTTCSNYADSGSTVIASVVHQINAICPHPLVIPNTDAEYVTRINNGACAPSCPINIWSDNEFAILDRLTLSGAIISFICTLFLTVTWSCFSFPNQNVYIKYMSYNLLGLFLVLIINYIRSAAMGADNGAQAICKNNVEEYHFEGYCLFQGMVFVYSILSTCSWWLVQAIDIFRALVLNIRFQFGSKLERNWKLVYHIFAWGLPAVAIIISLAARQIGGYNAGSAFCTLSEGRYTGYEIQYDLRLFYYPMFAYTIIGCGLMIIVMFRLWYISKKHVVYASNRAQGTTSRTNNNSTTQTNNSDPSKLTSASDTPEGQEPTREAKRFNKNGVNREICKVYTRIMIYLFSMAVIWTYLFFYKIYSGEKRDQWKEGLSDFYACLLIPNGEDCGDHPTNRMPFGLMITLTALTTFAGAITMVMNATSIDIYQEWAGFIYDRCYCCLCTVGCRSHCRQYSKHKDEDDEENAHDAASNTRHSESDGDDKKDSALHSNKHSNLSRGIVTTIPTTSPISSRITASQRPVDDDEDDEEEVGRTSRFNSGIGAGGNHNNAIEMEPRKPVFAGFSVEEDPELESQPQDNDDDEDV